MISGFINLNKPNTVSSNKALGILKHALRQLDIKEKVGHFGTLDPLASGVLPVGIGRATRLFEYSLDKIKEYEADFVFGAQSASLDCGTEITYYDFTMPERETIVKAIKSQIGVILQMPPIYSAKSVDGVRAYKMARQGETPLLKPKEIYIEDIALSEICDNRITVRIKCGGGTYVRAIARDIAKELGTTAVMTRLIRTKSGIFDIEDSVKLSEIENNPSIILKKIMCLEDYTKNFNRIDVTDLEMKRLSCGVRIPCSYTEEAVVYCGDVLLGIGKTDEQSGLYIKTWLL